MQEKQEKLGLWLLVFIAIGSMIGSGIFNSPKDLIGVANPQGAMVAWLIGGFGALMLALVFVYLNGKRPDLQSGIFDYAKEGFGNYMGFNSAWGYWSMGWLGNISYLLLFFKTLNDLLGEYALSPFTCFLIGSAINWFYFFNIASGIKEGAVTNFMVTVAKMLPIVLVVILGITVIDKNLLYVPDWKLKLASTNGITSMESQIKNAMAIVLWCFVGIEASSVLSGRAKNPRTVRKAILISFLVVLTIYVFITVVSMASIPANVLLNSKTPLALVLEKTSIGTTGSTIVKIGIMVSVLGAGLSWLLLSTETMYSAAKSGVMPKILSKENKNGTPINALFLSQIFTQIFLLAILLPGMNKTYLIAITTATSLILIPYFLSALYSVIIAFKARREENILNLVVAILGTLYSAYVIYAVGIKYLFLAILFYTLGSFLFIVAKKERDEKILKWERIIMLLLGICSVIVIFMLTTQKISL